LLTWRINWTGTRWDGDPRGVLDGRQPTQAGIQTLHDRLTDVVELDEQLGA